MKLGQKLPQDMHGLRLRLRPMKLKEDKFPDRVRVSTIASFWWCGWKSYATAILGLKVPEKEWMQRGTNLHDKLFDTLGKRYPWETRFIEEIDKFRKDEIGFIRKYKTGTNIYADLTGHPDDFQVNPGGEVSIIEYKTTRMPLYLAKRFITCIAEFQAKLYPYVLEPTIAQLHYWPSRYHAVMIHSSKTLELMHYRIVLYDRDETERKINEIFNLYRHPEEIKPPAKWKCKYCSDVFREKCPFYKKATK